MKCKKKNLDHNANCFMDCESENFSTLTCVKKIFHSISYSMHFVFRKVRNGEK